MVSAQRRSGDFTDFIIATVILFCGLAAAPQAQAEGTPANVSFIESTPLSFEPNVGQADVQAKYVARGLGYTLLLSPSEARITLKGADVRMSFAGARKDAASHAEDRLANESSYLIGSDPSGWHSAVPNFGRVIFKGVYEGIDLVYYGTQGHLEYDFVVAPGADPKQIHLDFEGTRSIALEGDDILLDTPSGSLRVGKPVVYQTVAGRRQILASKYVVEGSHARFEVGDYDKRLPLTIDPDVTFLGAVNLGSHRDLTSSLAFRKNGTASETYMLGYTEATPIVGVGATAIGPVDNSGSDNTDIFFLKYVNGILTRTIVIGGSPSSSSNDQAFGLTLDSTGAAYIVGKTNATQFPGVTGGPAHTGQDSDAFLMKLDVNGILLYSVLFGGPGNDRADAVAWDASTGALYIAGLTNSATFQAPGGISFLPTGAAGAHGAFVAAFQASNGQAMNGNSWMDLKSIVSASDVDALSGPNGPVRHVLSIGVRPVSGGVTAYVAGTLNPAVAGAAGALSWGPMAGSFDAFVAPVTFLGGVPSLGPRSVIRGSSTVLGLAIAVRADGTVFLTGGTDSPYLGCSSCPDTILNGGYSGANLNPSLNPDAFIARIAPGGTLSYFTYLGGRSTEYGTGIVLDPATSDAVVIGTAYGAGSGDTFPIVNGGQTRTPPADASEAFLARISITDSTSGIGSISGFGTSAMVYSTYIGGPYNDYAQGIAYDSTGSGYIYIGGYTSDLVNKAAFIAVVDQNPTMFKPLVQAISFNPPQAYLTVATNPALPLGTMTVDMDRPLSDCPAQGWNCTLLGSVDATVFRLATNASGALSWTGPTPVTVSGTTVYRYSIDILLNVPNPLVVPTGTMLPNFTVSLRAVNATSGKACPDSSQTKQWKVTKPASLQDVNFNPPAVIPGQTAPALISLSGQSGEVLTVTVTTAEPNLTICPPAPAACPGPITIPASQYNGAFHVRPTAAFTFAGAATSRVVNFTVGLTNANGAAFGTMPTSLIVNRPPSAKANIRFAPDTTKIGAVQGQIMLPQPATAAGTLTLTASSSLVSFSSSAAQSSTTVAINPGDSGVYFDAFVSSSNSQQIVTISCNPVTGENATSCDMNSMGKVTILPVSLLQPGGVEIAGLEIFTGGTLPGTVTLDTPAPAGGTTITLSSNVAAVQVPSSVTVPGGQTSAAFTLTALLSALPGGAAVIAPGAATVTAKDPSGTTATDAVTILTPSINLVSMNLSNGASIARGTTLTGNAVTINNPLLTALKVYLSSSDPGITFPTATSGYVTIPAGATSVTFSIAASNLTADTVAITASLTPTFDSPLTSLLNVTGNGSSLTPFCSMNVDANIERRQYLSNGDNFQVKGGFLLCAASNGINPPAEVVTLKVGTSPLLTIPAGSFRRDGNSRNYKFHGAIQGVDLNIEITGDKDPKDFDFHVEAQGTNLTGTVAPVPVSLTIGDDFGSGVDREIGFGSCDSHVDIDYRKRSWDRDKVTVDSDFKLGDHSDGIDPLREGFTFRLGDKNISIPRFSGKDRDGRYTFKGTVSGIDLDIALSRNWDGSYKLHLEGGNWDYKGHDSDDFDFSIGNDRLRRSEYNGYNMDKRWH